MVYGTEEQDSKLETGLENRDVMLK